MKLDKHLSQKESVILKRWLNSILDMYPTDTKRFLKKNRDPFSNPVGHTLSKETENLYRELIEDRAMNTDRVSSILDRMIRILSIQDFSPSRSILFLFTLKGVIEEELRDIIQKEGLFEDLLKYEAKIDQAVLIAFDIYVKCREKIYEIMANQAKNQVSGLLRKSGLVCEIPEWDPRREEENSL